MTITIFDSDPIWRSNRKPNNKSFGSKVESYSDTTVALGGYDNASFNINDDVTSIESWIESGLGRHIESYNPSNEKRWEGFVNQIQVALGPLSFTLGPILDVRNKVMSSYQDFSTGVDGSTSYSQDTASQDLYSVREKVLTAGKVSQTNAESIRDVYLKENKYPKSNQTLSGSQGPSLTVNCLGYYHLLDFIYNETSVAETSTYTLREKLIDIIAAEPNSIFSSDTSKIDTNTLSVFEYENQDKDAWTLIKELVAMGSDSNNNRMVFGIYGDLIPYYYEVPDTILYTQRLDDTGVNLRTQAGGLVDPWNVKVAQWIQFTDFLIGRSVPSDTFQQDPRIMFIESVTYTAPYDIQITGGTTDTLTAKLAKLGLGSI